LPLQVKFSGDARKYVEALDATTKNRVVEKVKELAGDPPNIRTSKPLISDVGPRNQIYRKA
jgi:mRNA-degrading endonuclease RelE of RelBE toxin-antitoxin system